MPFYFCFLSSTLIFICNLGCWEAILLLIHSCNWVFKGCLLSNLHRFTKLRLKFFFIRITDVTIRPISQFLIFEAFPWFQILAIQSITTALTTTPSIFCLIPGLLAVLKWASWTGCCRPLDDILRHWFMFFIDYLFYVYSIMSTI